MMISSGTFVETMSRVPQSRPARIWIIRGLRLSTEAVRISVRKKSRLMVGDDRTPYYVHSVPYSNLVPANGNRAASGQPHEGWPFERGWPGRRQLCCAL